MKRIYTVTTIRDLEGGGCRVIGYFFRRYGAVDAVLENAGDMYECGHYPYAVIEGVCEGIHPHTTEVWFMWDKDGYKEIPKPDKVKNICNWGIG